MRENDRWGKTDKDRERDGYLEETGREMDRERKKWTDTMRDGERETDADRCVCVCVLKCIYCCVSFVLD